MSLFSLFYNQELYFNTEISTFLAQFREKEHVVLPNVLKQETGNVFKKEIAKIMYLFGIIYKIPNTSLHQIIAVFTVPNPQYLSNNKYYPNYKSKTT